MKKLFLITITFFITISSYSQSNTFKIKGLVEDTLSNPLIYSTVLLLDKSDSTMLEFTRTAMDGSFKFKDIEAGSYLVKSSYIGYIPLTVNASSPDGEDIDLGFLTMVEIAEELMELVIKAAKAPLKMRGDTIEYDASTFKVPEGSTVEDLLRRLPGIEVDQDGSINADGKTVSKVTVDGKSFFGASPKAATKNLPAESISKVQVFDTKSEEEEITGATSQAQDKTMNLELKEDFKSGGFGKVIAGVGTEDRAELKGNYNRFNDKIQFSLVGVGNNTGRNGLGWNDYQDFLGSNSFRFENLEYGFGGGGGRMFFFGGQGNNLESTIQNSFFGGGNNGGFPENYNGGINFNYDHKKTKVNSVYFYNKAGINRETINNKDFFLPDFVQNEVNTTINDNSSDGHRVEFKMEQEIDSMHTLKVSADAALINQTNINSGELSLSADDVLKSSGTYGNTTNTNGYLGNAAIIFRKKFKKKGRSIGINTSFLRTQLEDDRIQNNSTTFIESGAPDVTQVINQSYTSIADKNQIKANALYVEPLSKRFFFQTFYNFSNREETGDRDVIDIAQDATVQNDFLSRTYENSIRLNRVGSSIRYSHNGMNIATGLAYQSFNLLGFFNGKGNSGISGTVDTDFNNLIPYFSLNFSPVRNSYIDLSYNRDATEPNISDLQPLIDNSNPLFIREGNATLTPEIANRISLYASRNFPASSVRISINGNVTLFENRFSTEQRVDDNLVTTFKPINLEGGSRTFMYGSVSFPIVANKFTVRLGSNMNIAKTPAIVNDVRNNTNRLSYSPTIRLNITPKDDFAVYINAGYDYAKTSYDINTSQDQTTLNTSLGIEFNTKLMAGFYWNSSFDYDRYTNDRFDLDQNVGILNASLYRQFLPNKQLELRLSLYDGLNQNLAINQNANGNFISRSETASLGRYIMLSATYNIKGMSAGVQKKGWWH